MDHRADHQRQPVAGCERVFANLPYLARNQVLVVPEDLVDHVAPRTEVVIEGGTGDTEGLRDVLDRGQADAPIPEELGDLREELLLPLLRHPDRELSICRTKSSNFPTRPTANLTKASIRP